LISGLLKEALEHPADGVTLIDSQGAVVFQNLAANICCTLWLRGKGAAAERTRPGEEVALPEEVSRNAKDLMARFLEDFKTKSLKGKKYEKEIPHPGGLPVSARARVIIPNFRPVPPHVRIEFSRVPSDDGRGTGLPVYRLSDGELRVALLVARGMRNHEVATELGVSVNTVRSHLREVFSKLGVSHRGQMKELLQAGESKRDGGADAAHS
jgi:DNA-binding CsgD family transcriptional regulator